MKQADPQPEMRKPTKTDLQPDQLMILQECAKERRLMAAYFDADDLMLALKGDLQVCFDLPEQGDPPMLYRVVLDLGSNRFAIILAHPTFEPVDISQSIPPINYPVYFAHRHQPAQCEPAATWHWVRCANHPDGGPNGGITIWKEEQGEHVTLIEDGDACALTDEDARLMASSPRLLAAAKAAEPLVRWAAQEEFDEGPKTDWARWLAIRDELCAAIAQAEGIE